jgi:hypothetical protein
LWLVVAVVRLVAVVLVVCVLAQVYQLQQELNIRLRLVGVEQAVLVQTNLLTVRLVQMEQILYFLVLLQLVVVVAVLGLLKTEGQVVLAAVLEKMAAPVVQEIPQAHPHRRGLMEAMAAQLPVGVLLVVAARALLVVMAHQAR